MYNILESTFRQTLEREGKEIQVDGKVKRAFFRRNETGTTDPHITVYTTHTDRLEQGSVFTLNEDKYIVKKSLTSENDTYSKQITVRCNAEIKWMFGKNDLVVFDVYMSNFSDSMSNSKYGAVLSSKVEFILQLDSNSRRISINDRFFCGSYHMAWKVSEIHYSDDKMMYLYAERDPILPSDSAEEGIANKWDYIDKEPVEAIPVGKIEVKPPYTDTSFYRIKQGYEKLFTCDIEGVEETKWNITINQNGNTVTNYTANVDDATGTFNIKNNKMSSNDLIVNILEESSGKTTNYVIKLGGIM